MAIVRQQRQIRAFAEQTVADTTVITTIPLSGLSLNHAAKITHIDFVVDPSGTAIWAAGNGFLLATLADSKRQIASIAFSSSKGTVAQGGSATIDCCKTWDDQDGFFTAQNVLALQLDTGATGITNLIEALIFYDIVPVSSTDYNKLLYGEPATEVG